MILEDVIVRNPVRTNAFKLVVNGKFYVNIVPDTFHNNKYKDVLVNYMLLKIVDEKYEYNNYRKVQKVYVESDDLEYDLLHYDEDLILKQEFRRYKYDNKM